MSAHPRDALHELLDGRLEAGARAALEEHLRSCPRCTTELEVLRSAREAARAAVGGEALPDPSRGEGLGSLRAALDREDASQAARPRRLVLAAAAGLAAVLLLAFGLARPSVEPLGLPRALAHDFAAYRGGTLALERVTHDTGAVQDFFAGRDLGFETRVFDLGMMGYATVGGRVLERNGVPSALFVYAREDGRPVICQMFPGRVEDLPAGAEHREHDGITFRIYRREGVTVVFWQEGRVVCALTSDLPAEEVVQLAFDKAMKAVAEGSV